MEETKKTNQGGNQFVAPAYAGVCVFEGAFFVAIKNGKQFEAVEKVTFKKNNLDQSICAWLNRYAIHNQKKVVSVGLVGHRDPEKLMSDLWLKHDIVPLIFHIKNGNHAKCAEGAALEAAKEFGNDQIIDIKFNPKRKIMVSVLNRLCDFKRTVGHEDFETINDLAREFKRHGRKIVFFSATPRGGGVAIMRHALMRIFRLLGVDASWYVLSPKRQVFEITKKKFHNILQGVAPLDVKLCRSDKKIIQEWTEKNVQRFKEIFKKADVIVIDDPQPSPMIGHIKRINPKAKIIYRSHIQIETGQMDDPRSAQNITWKFLWSNIKKADLFISQPCARFLPPDVPKEKTVFMAPATDKLDGLNKLLSIRQEKYYLQMFNEILQQNGQTGLDLKRPFIIQIARFDPSKGFPDVVESYRKLILKLKQEKTPKSEIPQLVICGHGSIDDPEGDAVYSGIISLLELDEYRKFKNDIKAVRLPHIDQVYNVLLRRSKIALQLSHKEGFEFKVTEALDKGVPVVAYRAGGIPLQIENRETGFLVKLGDTRKVAFYLYKLLKDKKLYEQMRNSAKAKVKSEYFTIVNAAEWLFLANQLLENENFKGNRKNVVEMMRDEGKKVIFRIEEKQEEMVVGF